MAITSKFSVVFIAAALGASLGNAQAAQDQTKTIVFTPPAHLSCPVTMSAEHTPGLTTTVPVKNGSVGRPVHQENGQELQLTLDNPKGTAITAIRIRVRGWDAKGHTMPMQSHSDYTDAWRTLDVSVAIAPHAKSTTDVWAHGMTAVDAIDLIGVTYADGTSWSPASLQVCSIMPDPTMLISSK